MKNKVLIATHLDDEILGCTRSLLKHKLKGDVHSYHRKIFEATKSVRYPFIKKIYMIETLIESEFTPNTKEDSFIPNIFVDISEFMDKKIKIMKVYASEVANHPFPRNERNIRELGTFRGSSSNCEYAESFMLLKEIR